MDQPFALFPVSVLKPLKGVDPDLEANLQSFFELDYPDFELLFSVASPADPAHALVRKLVRRNPGIKARVFVGEIPIGPNPKVNNLIKSYEGAANDWVLISDSNVRAPRDYLRRLVAHLDPGVGMVTAVVAGTEPGGAGGQLEATFLNTFYARWMCTASRLGKPCVVGKSMLFQRTTAARFGGLRSLGRYLAEDYMAGEAMHRLGLKVVIACDPVRQVIRNHTLESFWSRHLRWGRIRKAQAPLAFLLEPLTHPLISGCLGAIAAANLFQAVPAAFIAVHLLLWSACDLLLMRRLEGELPLLRPIYWFVRELLHLPLWLHIGAGNTVNWRGQRLTLLSGGILSK
jgi:ceramide glucosyltransferase